MEIVGDSSITGTGLGDAGGNIEKLGIGWLQGSHVMALLSPSTTLTLSGFKGGETSRESRSAEVGDKDPTSR